MFHLAEKNLVEKEWIIDRIFRYGTAKEGRKEEVPKKEGKTCVLWRGINGLLMCSGNRKALLLDVSLHHFNIHVSVHNRHNIL